MNQESAHLFLWSAEKQLRLHASLSGMWAEDSWQLEGIDWKEQPVHRTLCFTFPNNALKEEFKYAVWFQWTQGIWHGYHKQGQQAVLHSLRYLVTWPNAPEAQMARKGVRGQTLPVGGCGRLVVLGDCTHANKCLTCPMWLTSTDDLPALKSFSDRAIRLKQRALEKGNQMVVEQQDRIIPTLALRIKSLEEAPMDGSLCVDDVLAHLRTDLAEAECGLEEARAVGLVLATRHMERAMTELKMRIAALEVPDDRSHE